MKKIVVLLGIIFAGNAFPQTAPRVASIGYAYPAGGQKGTVVHVTVGGQNLRGVTDVYVSGEGVQATDVKYIPMLNALQRQELMKRLRAIREKHTRGKRPGRTASAAGKGETGTAQNLPKNVDKPSGEEKPVALP